MTTLSLAELTALHEIRELKAQYAHADEVADPDGVPIEFLEVVR